MNQTLAAMAVLGLAGPACVGSTPGDSQSPVAEPPDPACGSECGAAVPLGSSSLEQARDDGTPEDPEPDSPDAMGGEPVISDVSLTGEGCEPGTVDEVPLPTGGFELGLSAMSVTAPARYGIERVKCTAYITVVPAPDTSLSYASIEVAGAAEISASSAGRIFSRLRRGGDVQAGWEHVLPTGSAGDFHFMDTRAAPIDGACNEPLVVKATVIAEAEGGAVGTAAVAVTRLVIGAPVQTECD